MASPNNFALELSQVTKFYGDFKAVDSVSFAVPHGAIYGFLGPNGAGKTTTIRMILDILRPNRGTITILGNPNVAAVRDRIGYLPEEKGLYKKMRTWGVIAYFAALKGMTRRKAKRRAYELLDRYGLKEFAEAKTEALSKGMGQKVQVLASIAHDPELVILDEPFSGLDPVNQQVLEEVIRDLAARGKTTVFSTHVMQHAERLCDRVLLIAKGQKIFDGTILEARRTIPRRVRIETDDDAAMLAQLPEVNSMRELSGATRTGCWEIELRGDADAQAILRACFASGIRLKAFDHTEPSLHEVFVRLVGGDGERSET